MLISRRFLFQQFIETFQVHGMQVHGKRKLYIILLYAILQPFLIWWMTFSLVPITSSIDLPSPTDQEPVVNQP